MWRRCAETDCVKLSVAGSMRRSRIDVGAVVAEFEVGLMSLNQQISLKERDP